jgi:putative phosphoesterase
MITSSSGDNLSLNGSNREYLSGEESVSLCFLKKQKRTMKRIGLLSDTHGHLDQRILSFFNDCDEIWHAGDIGDVKVSDALSAMKVFRAVYGNIDGGELRKMFPLHQRFMCEKTDVWMTHIGGYPGNYDRRVRESIRVKPPDLFISGHSHILKVMPDKKLGLLHINPGAAGLTGFHNVRTAVRFTIDGKNIRDLEVFELPRH